MNDHLIIIGDDTAAMIGFMAMCVVVLIGVVAGVYRLMPNKLQDKVIDFFLRLP